MLHVTARLNCVASAVKLSLWFDQNTGFAIPTFAPRNKVAMNAFEGRGTKES